MIKFIITKEIAKEYLINCQCLVTGDFDIIDIVTSPSSPGVNEHPVIICKYFDENNNETKKNVHINIQRFIKWSRDIKINKILQ